MRALNLSELVLRLRGRRSYDVASSVGFRKWPDDQPCWNVRNELKDVGQNYLPTVGQNVRLLIENSLSTVKLKGNFTSTPKG